MVLKQGLLFGPSDSDRGEGLPSTDVTAGDVAIIIDREYFDIGSIKLDREGGDEQSGKDGKRRILSVKVTTQEGRELEPVKPLEFTPEVIATEVQRLNAAGAQIMKACTNTFSRDYAQLGILAKTSSIPDTEKVKVLWLDENGKDATLNFETSQFLGVFGDYSLFLCNANQWVQSALRPYSRKLKYIVAIDGGAKIKILELSRNNEVPLGNIQHSQVFIEGDKVFGLQSTNCLDFSQRKINYSQTDVVMPIFINGELSLDFQDYETVLKYDREPIGD